MLRFAFCLLILLAAGPVRAGLYYSAERQAELPSQWRGFLLDHRALRMIGIAPSKVAPTLLRRQYQEAAEKLVGTAKRRPLNADEAADLGAIYIRLGEVPKAIETLRAAQRRFPENFHLSANLGTAWQLQGDWGEAIGALRDAVRLAPAKIKFFEEYHLKLVQARQKEKEAGKYDDLFGVKFVGLSDMPEAGKIIDEEKKKLPEGDVAIVQQLALWLPADGRLLWQLGELANAHGDVRAAANLLDGCVVEFALASPDLRKRRQLYREAADAITKLADSEHEKYRGDLKMRSPRPLLKKLDSAMLPAIRVKGINALPWIVLDETTIGKGFKPLFSQYLSDLDEKSVALTGYMYPVAIEEMADLHTFMLVEYPIGCWFCETPDPTAMIFVSLTDGETTALKKGLVKVQGILRLNRTDPEQFLQAVRNASVSDPD